MQQEGRVCFPFYTKLSGIQTALNLTPRKSVFGVQLKQTIKANAGGTAQLCVSNETNLSK